MQAPVQQTHHAASVLKRGRFMAVRYDPTINLGHILSAFAMLACVTAAYYDNRTDIKLEQQKTSTLELQLNKTNEQVARLTQDNQTSLLAMRTEVNAWFIRFDDKLEKIREERRAR